MPGPAPKPAHLRQRTNKKAGCALLEAPSSRRRVPAIPNPDGRVWHRETLIAWRHALTSPMASQWIETDIDALGRLFCVIDEFYKAPSADALKEIRLQSALFGLSPLDRSRLQWEVRRAEEEPKRKAPTPFVGRGRDPRSVLMAVK